MIIKPKIYFRADGNSQIGLGHLVRSLALADMLKANFEIIFLIQDPSQEIINQIKNVTDLVEKLPESKDYLFEAQLIKEKYLQENDIIVLDGYEFKTDYQKKLKEANIKLVCIDDLHSWHFVADVVINHAGGIKKEDYSCESYTKLCLGLEYALLRSHFLEATKEVRNIKNIRNLFICFGGADSQNLTQKMLDICLKSNIFEQIHIVVGSAYLFVDELNKNKVATTILHQNLSAEQMVEVMQKCDLAIAPASGISYEICSVGLYFLTGYYVENQKGIYDYLVNEKMALGLGNFSDFDDFNIGDIVTKLQKMEMIAIQKKTFQNSIKSNFLNIFNELSVFIKKATIDDIKLYFDWANEHEVRSNSLNSAPISWENHIKWFEKKLQDKSTFFYIFMLGKINLGQVRIDLIDNHIGLINYSIDKQFRGLGFGTIIINKIIIELSGTVSKFNAIVKKENIASIKIFDKLGFSIFKTEGNLVYFEK